MFRVTRIRIPYRQIWRYRQRKASLTASPLTFRTEKGAALRLNNTANRLTTATAPLPFSIVHGKLLNLENTRSIPDSLSHGDAQPADDPAPLGGTEAASRSTRIDPRSPQRFTGIDVPHTGQKTLIEQSHFDGPGGCDAPVKVEIIIQRLWPKHCQPLPQLLA
jgi:hypothetical protein